MNDAGTSEITPASEAEALPTSDTGTQTPDSSTAAETPTTTDPQAVTYTTTVDPDQLQATKDLQSSVDSAHLTLIFSIAVVCGVVFAQNLLKGWFHA